MRKRLALIMFILLLLTTVTGCFRNNSIKQEKSNKENRSEIKKESITTEDITVKYWLGESGEQKSNYTITTEENGTKTLNNDRADCLLSGFEEYEIMLKLVFAKRDGKWGLYNKDGIEIIKPCFDEVLNPEMPDGYKANGLVRVKENELWGAVDQDGNMAIKPQFDFIHLTYYEEVEPFIKVEKNKKYGYLTANGKPLVDTVWDDAFMDVLNVGDDIIFVKQGDKWGGIRIANEKAAPVDWNMQPSEEAKLSLKKWKYEYQHDFYVNQIENGNSDISPATIIFFNDYFNKNSLELRYLPVFGKGRHPDWDQLTKFIYAIAITSADDLPVTTERFDQIAQRYLGNSSYSHKPSSYLSLNDGVYTAKGWSDHGSYIYELTGLEKQKTISGEEKWEASIKGYYFNELDGTPDEPMAEQSKNAQAVFREMKKEENRGLNFWKMGQHLVYNNPGSILEPQCEWIIEFTINQPLEDIFFTYISCEKKEISK